MLLLCFLIFETLRKDSKVKNLLIKSAKFLSVGIAGMVLYYLVLVVVLKITGTQLLEYQGFDNATSFSGIDIFASLYIIKESFFGYFFDFSKGLNLFSCINVLVAVLTLIFYSSNIIRNKLKLSNILLLFVFVLLLPVGASVLSFINSSIDYHNLMKMGFFGFYLLFILQYENTESKVEKFYSIKLWLIFAVTVVLIFNQVIIANISYHKLNIAYEKSYGTLIRIADRIEQTENSQKCEKILVLGALEGSEAYTSILPPDMTGTTDSYILREDDEIVGQSVLCSALNDYCGKNYSFVYGEEKTNLLKKIDKNSLSKWPDKNSIFIIDNVIVINLSD
jgi:hypothetical protein